MRLTSSIENELSQTPSQIRKPARAERILKDVVVYGLSIYVSKILAFFNKFILFRFLGPFQMGIFSILAIILDWADYSNLGVSMSVTQEVPRALARNQPQMARETQNLAVTFTFLSSLLFSFGVMGVAFFQRTLMPPLLYKATLLISFFIVIQQLGNAFLFLLKSYEKFRFIAKLNLISSSLTLLLTFLLTPRWEILGWIVALFLSSGVCLILTLRNLPPVGLVPLHRPLLRLIAIGVPLLGLEFVITAFRSVDRMVISSLLGLQAMGFYTMALTVSTGIYLFPYALGIVTFNHYQQVFAKRWEAMDLRSLVVKPTLILSYSLPFLIIGCWFLIPWFFSKWAPSYEPGLESLKILSLGSYFLCLTQPLTTFLVTIHKRTALFLGVTVIVLGLFLGETFLIRRGMGIEAIAIVSSVAFFLYFTEAFYLSARALSFSKKFMGVYLKALLCFGYLTFILFSLERWAAGAGIFGQFSLAFLLLSPLLFSLNRDTRLIQVLKEIRQK